MIGDVEYYVAPIVAMVQGVVHAMNAKHPEFVPADQLSTYGWDHRPVFVNHPMVNDTPVASYHPQVIGSHIGFTRNPSVAEQKLLMEVCIEKMKMTPELLAHIDSDEPFNVSMGAFVNSVPKQGEYGGKKYFSEWHDIDPDHMALLPATKGACSWEMGCGVRAAGELRAAWVDKSGVDTHGREANAMPHDKAALAHDAAARAHDESAATPTLHADSKFMREEATKASRTAYDQSSKLGLIYKESHTAADHKVMAGNHRYIAKAIRSGEIPIASAEFVNAWMDKNGLDSHGRDANGQNAAAKASDRASKASASAKDAAGNQAAQRAHEAAAEAHDLVVKNMIGYGTVQPHTEAAVHHQAANGHRMQATNHYHKSLTMKAAEEAVMHCYAEWLNPGDETTTLLQTLRNISQQERDKMSKDDFAGPNESFPISEPIDVHDASRAIGRAKGDSGSIKSKIISIAYRKGASFVAQLPDDWKKKSDQKAASMFARAMAGVKKILAEGSIAISDEALAHLEEELVAEEPAVDESTVAETRVAAAPCGCKGKTTVAAETKETVMQNEARIKALIAASNGMFGEADVKMLESATDEQMARYEAAAQATNKTLTDAAAAIKEASAKPAEVTFSQLLDKAPADVQAVIKGQLKAAADRKESTIKVLTDSGRCNFSKEQLASFDQVSLDNLVTLAAIKPIVDHSLVLPPANVEGQPGIIAAQTNETFNAKVKAKADAAKAAKNKGGY
jgi:hypothetical protein